MRIDVLLQGYRLAMCFGGPVMIPNKAGNRPRVMASETKNGPIALELGVQRNVRAYPRHDMSIQTDRRRHRANVAHLYNDGADPDWIVSDANNRPARDR